MNIQKIFSNFGKLFVFPGSQKISRLLSKFSITEKVLFALFTSALVITAIIMFFVSIRSMMVEIPAAGGTLREGVVSAAARYVNPVLAISDADRDITELVYSGLLKPIPNGGLEKDLAESYTISDDEKTYTFNLRDDAFFQDGVKVTADDVEYTIHTIQNSAIKSPKYSNWSGVTVTKLNEKQVQFTINKKDPYAPFLANLTIGILPKHIWKDVQPDTFSLSALTISPIGSGPYEVTSIAKNKDIPTSYTLTAFSKYIGGKPNIKILEIHFYPNEEEASFAYRNGDIDSISGVSPEKARQLESYGGIIHSTVLPRMFSVFFNQNRQPVFLNKEVRSALDTAVDKDGIVNDILLGFASTAHGPLPSGLIYPDEYKAPAATDRIAAAQKMLTDAGWKKDTQTGIFEKKVKNKEYKLEFSLAIPDVPDLKKVAQTLKETWEKMGAKVEVNIYERGNLLQEIIPQRKYDSLLYGQTIGRDLDLYAFWHSSQRNSPGLNIAMYANPATDKLLEQARQTFDQATLAATYKKFEKAINQDIPAIFLYSPDFIYITPQRLQNISLQQINLPSERFASIANWYIETDHVWKIFADKNKIINTNE